MKVQLTENGHIKSIDKGNIHVPFTPENGFGFGFTQSHLDIPVETEFDGTCYTKNMCCVDFSYNYETTSEYLKINIKIQNDSGFDFYADSIYFKLGIDSCMVKYPDWRNKYFPTLLRLEKTHFYGYFCSPDGQALAIIGEKPVASYDISYAHPSTPFYNRGHRIYNTSIVFYNNGKSAERLPQDKKILKNGEIYENNLYLIPLENLNNFEASLNKIFNIPIISAEKYVFELNEKFDFALTYKGAFDYSLKTPSGKIIRNEKPILEEYGLYKLNIFADNGYFAESYFFVRKDWDFYLYGAAKEAVAKQQKASTHTESWYGLFSLFLAQKYFKDDQLFNTAKKCFDEIMPLMFSFDQAKPLIIPHRIQNTALFISLLVDLYETDKENNIKYLSLASLYGDYVIGNQADDGSYRSRRVHYTCVIYIAKSLLDLALAEKDSNDEQLIKSSKKHYASVKKAIDELVLHLDNIDTEGELTFEDGMISCSALQIAQFALTLDIKDRKPYVDAAEKMLALHACLEQRHSPDCRTNGCSLRFWESQYDVIVLGNTFNSPHGWTAWTVYAQYYLYMLTGKKQYLLSLINTISACTQLLSLDGTLRWAFFPQPYVKLPKLYPDYSSPVKDGYSYTTYSKPTNRGKIVDCEFSEEYVDMISDWYRTGEQKVSGGYKYCMLYLPDGMRCVDNQGGCCDNDVHEIFKCLEETVFRKAFLYQNEDGSFTTSGCSVQDGEVCFTQTVTNELIFNLRNQTQLIINGKNYNLNGFSSLKL